MSGPAPLAGGGGTARTTVRLTVEPLALDEAGRAVADPACGAVAVFAGSVRDHHAGAAVVGLAYEAWEERAEALLGDVARSVADDFPDVRAIYVAHRLGELAVGELSVVVAASSPHRAAAFAAARELLEGVKRRVPIWKREFLAEGGTRWPGTDV